ncbi:TlpA family protein disulfide reductase [Carboxylicivirga marina]|uniref:TlpA family protein disulfide reductase n=1 Tax=Carboxylicivirga marina TaxID=2800988 RepID=A0ABS1HKJ9_9BACT|nr:TlpA disulfide reductase family protein [Carboxylicivirga marina]MBK3518198.1 TlpA family protein disulfide reductase [Carboxylicivirga marina]
MKNLNILVLLIALIGAYSCSNAPKTTTVELHVGDLKSRLYLTALNEQHDLFQDSEGFAKIELNHITEPCFANVKFGVTKQIYLEPGNHIVVKYNGPGDIRYEGDQAEVNTFLNERAPLPFTEEMYSLALPEFMQAFDRATEKYAELVNSKSELATCASMLKENKYYDHWTVAIIKYFAAKPSLSKEEYARLLQFLQEQDAQSSRFTSSPDAINRCITALYKQDEPNYRSYSWDKGTTLKLNWLNKNINDRTIKQHFIHTAVDLYITYAGTNKGGEIFKAYKATVDDKTLLDKFDKKVNEFKNIVKGSPVPEFKFQDANGQSRSLEEFKGKYVYIDLWATWCGHCIEQFPYLKELKKEYKHNNIVFLGVNNDRKLKSFTNYVEKHKLEGEQWYVGQDKIFSEFFHIASQPRFILLDPQGRIYDAHMLRPDNTEALKSYLDQLEGI